MQNIPREYLEEEDLEYWRLTEDPFEDPMSPEDVFLHSGLRSIERAILRAVWHRQIVVLTGDPGAGKSTTLRRFYRAAGREKGIRLVSPAAIDRKLITPSTLAVAILRDLVGEDTTSMALEARSELLRRTLEEQTAAGVHPVLLIDEGHHLSNRALIGLKQIYDSHTMVRQLAMVILGQTPLERRLCGDQELRELTGRARLLRLPELGAASADYLRWRFARVGGDADRVFEPQAYAALASAGRYPLWLNNHAVAAMRHAREVGDERVSAGSVGRS